MSSTAARALSGYRRLFRARKQLFQHDLHALRESGGAIRAQFVEHRNERDPAQLEELLAGVDEAEHMLLNEIVQGKLNESSGNYEIKVKKEHAEKGDKPANQIPTMEPVTSSTVEKITETTPKVEVTKTKT